MVVRVNHAVVATTWHRSLALAREQTVVHREVIMDAFVVGVHVVDVVDHVRHVDRQTRAVVVVIRGGCHQPRACDDGRRTRVDLFEVVVLRRRVVNADVHLARVVVKINPCHVIWVAVAVGGLAVPLNLCASGVPADAPLVDLVVGIVCGVDVAVVNISIVDGVQCSRAA